MQKFLHCLLSRREHSMKTPGKTAILLIVLPMTNVSVQQISTYAEGMETKRLLEQEFIHRKTILIWFFLTQ